MNKRFVFILMIFVFFFIIGFYSDVLFAAAKDCCREECVATDPPICNGTTVNICDYCDVNKYFYYRCSQFSCSKTCTDADKDGYGKAGSTGCPKTGVDCNDANASIHPAATEICGNGVDEDCSGADLACAPKLTISVLQPTIFEFTAGNYVTFRASAFGGSYPYKLSWQSDLDGALYSGYDDYYSTNKLSVGSHSISLTVTDNLGATANKTLSVAIKATSSLLAAISSPYGGDQFPVGSSIYFNSMVSGAKSPATYTWSSDKDGVISTSNFFSTSALSLGDHKITLTVTDASAKTVVSSISIKVISGMVLKVYGPAAGSYEQGTAIYFSANAVGGTSPYVYTWSSDKDGLITGGYGGGAGGLMKNDLSLGTHLVTVSATDAIGAKVSQSFTIEIVKPQCFDDDKDGYGKVRSSACSTFQVDCDDTNPSINPLATEVCPNTVDENCNGSITDCPVTLTVLSPASDGMTFTWGSPLNIRIKGTPIVSASISIYDSADKSVGYATLYDDGKHNDGAAGDDIWGADTILVYPDGSYYFNAFVNGISYKKIRNLNINNMPACTTLVNNGNSADKLDIVFIADQYTAAEMPNFVAKVQSASTHLLGLKPFDTQSAKINIHRVDSPVNLGCAGWGAAQPNCYYGNISAIAKLCPNDKTIVVADGNYRSFAYFGGFANVAANDSRFVGVVAHEFGHSFGLLDDEYTDSGVPDPGTGSVNSSVNCDTSTVCAKWNTVVGTGCFLGCDYRSTYYRSIYTGIMKDSRPTITDYGIISINRLIQLFTSYK